jgi:hypothetical protein
MAYTTHSGNFGPCGDRAAPVADGVGAKLRRLARRLTGGLAAQRQREVDREIARLLARSGGRLTDSMEREMMRKAGVRLEPAAVAARRASKPSLNARVHGS